MATSALFSASGNCVFCHDQWGGALRDAAGRNVSITGDWQGTMMAHSFQDPLWQAVVEAEVAARPELRGFIEDKCQTCHAPMARTQHRHDGGGPLPFAGPAAGELASDGVSCTLCHQIQPDLLGEPAGYSGGFVIRDTRRIFGPYEDVLTMPMQRHVAYVPEFGTQVQESAFCGTCHTLHTPVLDAGGAIAAWFPEQTPYLEWLAGDLAREGTQCQDCHMPRLDEAIKISARPPWLGGRRPFWRHQFAGGNAFMLRLMSGPAGSVGSQREPQHLARTAAAAREQLRRAVSLEVKGRRHPGGVELDVRVVNRTGHKLPTGHPYRRAWLHVQVRDATGRVRYASGTPDASGTLPRTGPGYAPHHDEITTPEQVQIYESVMGDSAGERTYGLLAAVRYLKDNRIPPRGFDPTQSVEDVAVRGRAVDDSDFAAPTRGSDTVRYRLDLAEAEGPLEADVVLFYQAVPPEAVAHLEDLDGAAARRFTRWFRQADNTPEELQRVVLTLE
ncbi:MAG: hypothetical protein H7A47_09805 [Verrucomicrobiales bacterium]|nr:hypothetical protein [Verrucomicrobiales bacterium]